MRRALGDIASISPLSTAAPQEIARNALIAAEALATPVSATLSSPVRDLLLGLYEARMNGSAEVTNERLKLISDLLGIEAFACAHPYQQCSRWCGVEARCTVAFKQSSDISSAVEKRSPTQNGDSK